MPFEPNFLTPDIAQIRHQILQIDESYNNPWDLLAELCQNAVDAIRSGKNERKSIQILVDATKRTISVEDNGIGISPIDLPNLLKPFSTLKNYDPQTVGEKGVGLTFAMFSCNHFEILSGNPDGVSKVTVEDAFNWKKSRSEDVLPGFQIDVNPLEKIEGTKVILENIPEEDSDLFTLNHRQIEFVLRTATAIGNTKQILQNDISIDVQLKTIDREGNSLDSSIPFKYWMFYESDPTLALDLEEYIQWRSMRDRTDTEKRQKLRDKIIYKKGVYTHADNRTIHYVACFVPNTRVWKTFSTSSGLCTEENYQDETWLDQYSYLMFQPGIFTSVKGMPTGISVDHPRTGWAGYWSNVFILFEDSLLKFDIGRKSIPGGQKRMYREDAKKIFNLFISEITKYISGDPTETVGEWDKDEAFATIEQIMDLGYEQLKFQKNPKDQEASVFALFFECIGRGIIRDITPLHAGHKNKYDLFAKSGDRRLVIEFKNKLRKIKDDFLDARKLFNEINCIVCWDVTDDDKQILENIGITVVNIHPNLLRPDPDFPHASYKIMLSGFHSPVYVIDLKEVLNKHFGTD